ncbi:MAG: SO_0444 family Cu/Zn efflux transporter [Limisphaerales bacterium]|jgi:uncharacterized membrane protein YraQ (UPF0718 family)|nr:SO_0444 family Cu/Zn efflux transporter [Verrucomicrobiota bacterium]
MSILKDYIHSFWFVFTTMAPWLLFGFFVAGLVGLFFTSEQIKRHLSGGGFKPILKAVSLGIPLPLCSCGTIPVAATLRKEGASKGATGAFLIATPQTGVDSMVVTFSILGWVFGVIRPFLALITGLLGGVLIQNATKNETETVTTDDPVEPVTASCCSSSHQETEPGPPAKSCCSGNSEEAPMSQKKERRGFITSVQYIFSFGLGQMLGSVKGSLLLGIAIAALAQQFLPENLGADYIKGNYLYEFGAIALLSIPIYVCSTASVPIAATLMLKGISPGAALVFLVLGPAVNGATITTMFKILGGKAGVIYLAVIATCSIALGTLLNLSGIKLMPTQFFMHSMHETHWISMLSGILLAALMLRAFLGISFPGPRKAHVDKHEPKTCCTP